MAPLLSWAFLLSSTPALYIALARFGLTPQSDSCQYTAAFTVLCSSRIWPPVKVTDVTYPIVQSFNGSLTVERSMAEPASGVITLITFSLVVIRETKKFIQETRDIPNDLQRRIDRLENFEKYMEVIEKHCKQGSGCGEELLQYINDSLSKQKPQLDQLQKILRDLASRGSDTLFQKVKMQIRKKLSEKELNDAMDELTFHQHFTTLFMGVGLL